MRLGLDVRLTYYSEGGIGQYIRRLAAALPLADPRGEHVHLYRRGHRATFAPAARRVDCWTPAHHWLEPLSLALEISRLRLDLLHSPDFIPPLWGARRTIITVHDLTFLYHPEYLTRESRRYYHGHIRRAVRQADAISADSQSTKDDLVRLLSVPADRVTVIYLGLDPRFCPLPPEEVRSMLTRLGLSAGYILFVGTFEPRKNIPGLLRAYHQLRRQLSDAPRLVLTGHRGWLADSTEALLEELDLKAHVRVFEGLPAEQLPALYNGAGVLALPSHYEGFGFPVLEAMGCGVPAVIAGRGSLPEIAGDAALAVDPDHPESIADGLRRALTDEDLRLTLRRRGLERARQFTWSRTVRETLALYDAVLRR